MKSFRTCTYGRYIVYIWSVHPILFSSLLDATEGLYSMGTTFLCLVQQGQLVS